MPLVRQSYLLYNEYKSYEMCVCVCVCVHALYSELNLINMQA